MSTAQQTMFVKSIDQETDDVIVIRLAAKSGNNLPEWEPGAHIDVFLPSGLIRQYSLCGKPDSRDEYAVAVLREAEGRGGSIELHDAIQTGDQLAISSPRNHFPLVDAGHTVFVAGGIGITPFLPMIAQLQATGQSWQLVYGGRSFSTMAFLEELKHYPQERIQIVPQDEKGLLDIDQIVALAEPEVAVYGCGPAGMLAVLEDKFKEAGKSRQLHVEHFSVSVNQEAEMEGQEDHDFDVELAQSGLTLHVPADKSLKEVLLEANVDVPFSCEEGYCGSCETAVLSGIPDHRCSVLTEEERESNEYMMVCVGRCKGDKLVLDR